MRGSFTNSLPIQVPPFHGIEPHVSLDYDSAAGNGEIGVGWRLSVGSKVVRGGPRGSFPRYDANDVFLLDGKELVACTPSCPAGGTHETRERSFERIVFDGTRWTRWQRDGLQLVYEASNEYPATAYEWSLASVIDTHGNTVTYQQDCPNHCFVDRITYADSAAACSSGQPACKLGAVIRFVYEARPDIVTYPTGKGTKQMRQRLRTVDVRMDGGLVTAYRLNYEASALTGNSLLRSVQQFPRDSQVSTDGIVKPGPTPPLPPVTFTTTSMSHSQPPHWTSTLTSGPFSIAPLTANAEFPPVETSIPKFPGHRLIGDEVDGNPQSPLYGDFDGDHRVDAASWNDRSSSTCSPLYARLATRSRDTFLSETSSVMPCPETGYAMDLNGDGVDDILMMSKTGDLRRAISNRDGKFTIEPTRSSAPWSGPFPRQCAPGDLNGDGLGDLVCLYQSFGSPPRIGTMLSTADAGWVHADQAAPSGIDFISDVRLITGDVDASTTSDIMLAAAATDSYWRLFTGYTSSNGSIGRWSTTESKWWRGRDDRDWRLASADFDGDARSDYALILDGSGVHIALSEKGSSSALVVKPTVDIPGGNVAIGDADGDGRDDILTGSPVGVRRSNGDGTFAAHNPFSTSTGTASAKSCGIADNGIASAADVNGDGQVDFVCSTLDANTGNIQLWIQPSPVAVPSTHRWTSFDQNGVGRQDLFSVQFRNPGYDVYTLTAQASGGYISSHKEILPDVQHRGGPFLANPDAGGWIAMDVGGPNGVPDGKSDLVLLHGGESALDATTLLSTGSDWIVRCDAPPCVKGTEVPAEKDAHSWHPADIDGDGKADLVHFQPLSAGVAVEYLRSNGDGTWTFGVSKYFESSTPTSLPLTRKDVNSFRIEDLNGDGLSDFVHVEVSPASTYITIRSLLSTGPAAWREETIQRHEPIDSAAALQLQPIDFDGDGVPDLGRAIFEAGCIRVEAYVRDGEDWSWPHTTPCKAASGLEDRRNLVLADVNQDGRTDVYHLSRTGNGPSATNSLLTLLNPGDPARPWLLMGPINLPISDPDSWGWIGLDSDHDGVGELAHIGGISSAALRTLHWTAGDDRLTGIDNGRGATTTIAYRAQAEARSYLPAAMLPIVVDRITVGDVAYRPQVQATATFTYGGAQWSTQYRHMIGFETVHSKQGKTVMVTGNDLTDACGARPAAAATESASGGIIARTKTEFVAAGNVAPFKCLPATTVHSECELTTQCSEKHTAFTYDDYGNLEMIEESGADTGRRRTYAPVHPNVDDYIVDRPYKREVLVPDPSSPQATKWLTKARSLFGYDDDTWEHSPHKHGDLTSVTEFSDIAQGTKSEKSYAYDDVGNLTRTTNPVGVTSTTIYDPLRSLFPISVCNPIGYCSTNTWDETLELVRSVTDPNQQTTITDYDAFGRPTLTTRPDNSSTRIQYLDTGAVSGGRSERQRTRVETSDGSPVDGVHWHEDLIDGLGRVYQSVDEGAGSASSDELVIDKQYSDASDRPAATSTPHTVAEQVSWTFYGYDAAHRPDEVTYPGGSGKTSRTFKVAVVEDIDELGHVRTTHHDAFGRTVQVDEHVRPCTGCAPETYATHYSFDAMDRLHTITDAASYSTTILRDDLGRETSISDPDRGTRTRMLRPDGSLEVETEANGTRHTWTYDGAGRPSDRRDDGASAEQKAHWYYDLDPTTQKPQGFSHGRPTAISYSTAGLAGAFFGTKRFWYDELGRPTRSQYCVDTVCHEMGSTYDPAGRLSDLRYPKPGDSDGEHVKYTYDPAGRLTSVGGFLTNIEHNALGQTSSQRYGNGLIEQFSYDPDRLWIDTQTLGAAPKPTVHPIYTATYGHDLTAMITNLVTTNPTPSSPKTFTQTYGYDELSRLTSFTSSDRPSFLPERYVYDAIGRIMSTPSGGTYHYDDPAHVHAVTSTSDGDHRDYDARGNLNQLTEPHGGRQLSVSWGQDGMPDAITDRKTGITTTIGYDPDGQRVRKETGSETTYYVGSYLEQTSGKGLTKYYWAGDQLIAQRGPDGKVSYPMQDHLHSTRVVTDEQGNVTARYNYEPFGVQKPDSQVDATTRRWQDQHSDDGTGFVYMNARYYDPQLGQFISPDSIIPDVYDPQSLHGYSFVANNPINFRDPSGHVKESVERRMEQAAQSVSSTRLYGYHGPDDCGVFQGCERYSAERLAKEAEEKSKQIIAKQKDELDRLAESLLDGRLSLRLSTLEGADKEGQTLGPCEKCRLLESPEAMAKRVLTEMELFGPQYVGVEEMPVPEAGSFLDKVGDAINAFDAWYHRLWPYQPPGPGEPPQQQMVLIPFGGGSAAAELVTGEAAGAATVESAAMRLDYQLWREGELVKEGQVYSGAGQHAEPRLVTELDPVFQPGDSLVLQGGNTICGYGPCRSILNNLAKSRGVSVSYYADSWYKENLRLSLTYFEEGVGHIKAPRFR